MKLKALAVGSSSILCYLIQKQCANARTKSTAPTDFNLKLVQVVFRHGARTPLTSPKYLPTVTYPESFLKHEPYTCVPFSPLTPDGQPYKPTKQFGKGHHGKLTAAGAQQMYEFGCRLRDHYVKELGYLLPEYTDEEVFVRATEIPRAIESARSTLAGLFPDTNESIPVVIHAVDTDAMFPNFEHCPYLKNISKYVWLDPDLIDDMKATRQKIQIGYNMSPNEDVHLVTLRDNIACNSFHGLMPEEYLIPHVESDLEKAAIKIMDTVFAGSEKDRDLSLQLGIGPLLGTFLKNIDAKINGENRKKMLLFSGHDTTLIPLLHALGINDDIWPPYGADIRLELYEKQPSDHFIRVLYLNEEKVIDGCDGAYCPLEQFKKAIAKYNISSAEYDRKCNREFKGDRLLQHLPKVQ